jgi:S1-C subfamily serine protease
MVRRSGQMGVPVITVDDEVVVGFDRPRLEQILARRQKKRPVLGAEVASAIAIGRKRGLDLPAGAYVGGVTPGSAAAQAGLREGDVLLSLNRRPVRDANDIERALNSLAVGQAAEIVWWRDGQELRAQVLFS